MTPCPALCRFKQLRAVLLADSADVAQAGKLAGCYAVHELGSWPAPAQLAARVCKLLQVRPWAANSAAGPHAAETAALPALAAVLQVAAAGQQADAAAAAEASAGEEDGDDVIDMLLLSLDAAHALDGGGAGGSNSHTSKPAAAPAAASCPAAVTYDADSPAGCRSTQVSTRASSQASAALAWADALLSQLNQVPGFRDTVLLSLVVGPGERPLSQQPLLVQEQPLVRYVEATEQQQRPQAAALPAAAAPAGCPPVRRPLQSYQLAGRAGVAVDAGRPALVVHRLAGVIRRAAARACCWEARDGCVGPPALTCARRGSRWPPVLACLPLPRGARSLAALGPVLRLFLRTVLCLNQAALALRPVLAPPRASHPNTHTHTHMHTHPPPRPPILHPNTPAGWTAQALWAWPRCGRTARRAASWPSGCCQRWPTSLGGRPSMAREPACGALHRLPCAAAGPVLLGGMLQPCKANCALQSCASKLPAHQGPARGEVQQQRGCDSRRHKASAQA